MEQSRSMKRLYVGGLNHSISQTELQQRFEKFGDVSDVDIVTRKDEQGDPVKTFGYLNINISETELRKCVSILNKTKWKGGTLQIELAKESFLHRLAEERQQAAEKKRTPRVDRTTHLVESLKKVGVENFHMKAAVPGTEVPDHKDWVVSKFGRVLPVLRLKTQGNNKIVKCDPSKHCHNIKRLDPSVDSENVTPVSKLTWQVAGGDDEISKKRRGEFPAYKVQPKKKRCTPSNGAKRFEDSDVEVAGSARAYKHFEDQDIKRGSPSELNCYISSRNSVSRGNEQPSTSKRQTAAAVQPRQKPVCLFDGDLDSEDEIRMMVAQENRKNKVTVNCNVEELGDLEVVGDEFSLKYTTHWAHQKAKGGGSKKMSERKQSLKDLEPDSREYDSADTDEILTFNNKTESSLKKTQKDPEMVKSEGQNGCDAGPSKKTPTIKVKKTECGSNGKSVSLNSVRESGSDDDSDDSGSCVDSDYEAMMQNCYRLELSLADLEQLAKKSAETSEEDSGESSSVLKAPQHVLKVAKSQILPPAKNSTPEAILAAILKDSSDDYDGGKRKKKKTAAILPAFKGTKTLAEPENREEKTNSAQQQKRKQEQEVSKDEAVKKQKTSIIQEQKALSSSSSESSSSEEEEEMPVSKPPPFKGLKSPVEPASQNLCQEKKPASESRSGSSSNSSSDSEEGSSDEETEAQGKGTPKIERTKTAPAKSGQSLESKDASKKAWESKKAQGVLSSKPENVRKHQQDNEKRLAALQQRQNEAEEQKKLIQGALSKLDTPETSTSKHILFDSEEESDRESRQTDEKTESCSEMKKSLFEESEESSDEDQGIPNKAELGAKEFKNKAAGKLFESEDDEDAHSEEDGERFQIKPQYEGKAGKKLMELQSRFGRDERFRMDSRFLESDNEEFDNTEEIMKPNTAEEEELAEEKKKNLEILQNLLHINVQTAEPSKETAKKKTFRDVTALHYDPTREEHAAFETKIEEPKKESKAERRRNREEAEKLPEVSKEIYYDVAVDFKEVFSSTKTKVEDKAEIAWDQEVDEVSDMDTAAESQAAQHAFNFLSDTTAENEQSAGFKFSFFGDDPVDEIHEKEDLYKIESLKSAKITWQEDQRFQDSSSEEEEDEQESGEKTQITTTDNETLPGKKMNFFFFLKDDERLKEGPKMFCRSINLEEERERWEDSRSLLIEEYRKRHKDARRKFKAKQRN
ncbi:nucleolar protein 8-like [Huso huso]|uniref:Nucleolar protein 8-like n=1 Tax=Huso huso TaxID=61971 RepID=A0ABR0Z7D1_HUSHU